MRWHCNSLPWCSTTEQQHFKRGREKVWRWGGISLAQQHAGSTGGGVLSGSDPNRSHLLHNHGRLKRSPGALHQPGKIILPLLLTLPNVSICYRKNYMCKIFVQMYYASLSQGSFHTRKLFLTKPYPSGILPGHHLHALDCLIHQEATEVTASYSAAAQQTPSALWKDSVTTFFSEKS